MNYNYKKAAVFLVAVGLALGALHYSGIDQYFTLHNIKESSLHFKEAVDRNYLFSVITYLVCYMALIACGLPIVGPLTLMGGFLFGVFPGVLYALIGAVTGSVISFTIMRYFLVNLLARRYARQLEDFNERIKSQGSSYLLTMHFLSVVPFFVVNALAALADMPVYTVAWTSAVGSLPLLFIYAFAGRELYAVESVNDLFSPHIFILLGLLALLAFVPVIVRKIQRARGVE